MMSKDWTGRKIYIDSTATHDNKYSEWRRNIYPDLQGFKDYCTDIDFIEWRNGKAVAVLELKRCSIGEAVTTVLQERFGFQGEAMATFARALQVPAYIVAIEDADRDSKTYERATFTVVRMNLPTPWLTNKTQLVAALLAGLGEPVRMDELAYSRFLHSL